MADNELTESMQKDLDIIIQEARKNNALDARRGLEILVARLEREAGYYTWIPLGEESLAVWQLRLPRENLPEEQQWLKEEPARLVHICNPVGYLIAAEARDKSASSENAGYVADKQGELSNEEEFVCKRCKRKMPDDLAKKGKMHVFFHTLKRKVE